MTQYDIEKIVLKPTWKEVLLELIAREKLDPWNIEISILADSFLKRINEMKMLELRIPANIILASAILLKYKSDVLQIKTEVIDEAPESYEEADPEEIGGLELVSRIPPKRQVSIDELIEEMEQVLKYDAKKTLQQKKIEKVLTLPAPQFDIEKKMEYVFRCIKENADKEGWTTFSELVKSKKVDEMIYTLLSLLHLWQKKLVDLKQDEFFGEIFIKVCPLDRGLTY